jgi:two-component system, NarL family, nitrate/nitrite response regulator NarL
LSAPSAQQGQPVSRSDFAPGSPVTHRHRPSIGARGASIGPQRAPGLREGPIRTLIVAEIRLYRDGLAEILARAESIEVVCSAENEREALLCMGESPPDVALVDIAISDGIGAVRRIVARAPSCRVLALAVPEVEDEVIACAEAGAAGYVTRNASLDDLVASVESVARDEMLCSPRVAASLLRRVRALAEERGIARPDGRLTRREIEIVGLIEQGMSNKEIARDLCIELATVKNHVHHILGKLNVHRRGEVAPRMRAARTVAV